MIIVVAAAVAVPTAAASQAVHPMAAASRAANSMAAVAAAASRAVNLVAAVADTPAAVDLAAAVASEAAVGAGLPAVSEVAVSPAVFAHSVSALANVVRTVVAGSPAAIRDDRAVSVAAFWPEPGDPDFTGLSGVGPVSRLRVAQADTEANPLDAQD